MIYIKRKAAKRNKKFRKRIFTFLKNFFKKNIKKESVAPMCIGAWTGIGTVLGTYFAFQCYFLSLYSIFIGFIIGLNIGVFNFKLIHSLFYPTPKKRRKRKKMVAPPVELPQNKKSTS